MAGYRTALGECLCGDASELINNIENESVNLVITSPPFALQRKKAYGNEDQENYVEWMAGFGEKVYEKLRDDGSFVIDLGGAYQRGVPAYSLYQFKTLIKLCDEMGFYLAQPFYWHNTSALPAPIEWVNKRKMRAKNSVNTVWWLCKNPLCKADVRNVLVPYSDRMKKFIEKPDEFIKANDAKRPSGHVMKKESWGKDNGGAIPPNLLSISNSESNSQYLRYCKTIGHKGHPARFPSALPEFFIKMLTDENDVVMDIFSGSNTTGKTAETYNRRWISFELSQEYVAESIFRFIDNETVAKHYYREIMKGKTIRII